jgi:hypothetical protein
MVLLGGALAQGGQACVAGAAVAVDADHEEHQQRPISRKQIRLPIR